MPEIVVIAERERLDRIAKAAVGSEREGGVEALLDANPGLAALGAFAPFNTRLVIPETVAAPAAARLTRPWE